MAATEPKQEQPESEKRPSLAARALDKAKEGAKNIAGPLMLTLFMIGVLAATVAGLVIGLNELNETDPVLPEIGLTLVLVVSVIGLLAVLSLMGSAFGLLGMNDAKQPLALPPGSVQAIIAISLILIFAIVSVHLHGQAEGDVEELTGVTAEQLAAIPAEEIIDQDRATDGAATFTVSRRITNEAAEDLRTQLLTTISTLVVAVAGFYFGSKTTSEGVTSGSEAALSNPDPSKVVTPEDQAKADEAAAKVIYEAAQKRAADAATKAEPPVEELREPKPEPKPKPEPPPNV